MELSETAIILASVTAPGWQGSTAALRLTLLAQEEEAEAVSFHVMQPFPLPCASESHSLQPVFLATSHGCVPARRPRGPQLEPCFVPVPGNALCAERSDCHGEELLSYRAQIDGL